MSDGPQLPLSIFSTISLPCGRTVSNRLVKVAMYEHLAALFGGLPNEHHYALYHAWSTHDWGMIITGNVQVSPSHLSLGRDMIIPSTISDDVLERYSKLAAAIHGKNPRALAIMQLSHAGRQSPNVLGGRLPFASPIAPSPIPVGSSNEQGCISHLIHRLTFQTPREMNAEDMDEVVDSFVRGATVALQAGFDGVQLHVAHGYLLASFLSMKTNMRLDEYSCHPEDALHLIKRIISSIRAVVPPDFVLGIKINSSDYIDRSYDDEQQRLQEERALQHICAISSWNTLDFIEISGGDYERPEFMTSVPSTSTSPRQAFFSRFSSQAVTALSNLPSPSNHQPPLVLLTGGFRTPQQLKTALSCNHAQLLGLGRGSVLCPGLPDVLRYLPPEDDILPFAIEPDLDSASGSPILEKVWGILPKIKLIGAGTGMAWYVGAIRQIANDVDRGKGIVFLDGAHSSHRGEGAVSQVGMYNVGGMGAVLKMWFWF